MSIFLELFLTFFKIGLFTFGGGYAMLPLIQVEVASRGWIAEEALVDFIAVSESTPGPFAINIATYIGTQTGGVLGAMCATGGVVLPSFIVILIVARMYKQFKESKVVSGVMTGLRPAVIGLIGSAIVSIGATVFVPTGFADINWFLFAVSAVIFAVSAILTFKVKLHPILIIIISALLGILSGIVWG